MPALIAITLSIMAGALAQLAMKVGVQEMTSLAPNKMLALGIGLYTLALFSWIIALKKYDLSYAYPMLSLGYVLVYIGAFLWPALGEELTWNKSIGVILVTVGVTLSTKKDTTRCCSPVK